MLFTGFIGKKSFCKRKLDLVINSGLNQIKFEFFISKKLNNLIGLKFEFKQIH